MEMNPAPHPHYRDVALKDEVLNGLLCTAQVYRRLLNVQQDRLNFRRSEASKLQPEQRRHFAGYTLATAPNQDS